MFYLCLEYFVLSGDIDLVMHFLRGSINIFSKTLPPLNQNAVFEGKNKNGQVLNLCHCGHRKTPAQFREELIFNYC